MNVDDIVRAKVEAARRRIAADKERRARLAAARARGLARRHAQKLRNLAAQQVFPGSQENLSNSTLAASGA